MKTKIICVGSGKRGIGKTSLSINLIPYLLSQGIKPKLFDFDWENTDKSGLQNFYPEAQKLNIHSARALDEFFEAVDNPAINTILADLPAGSGEEVSCWCDEVYSEASELEMEFILAAVTTNEAGSVQSTLKWGAYLQDQVKYIVCLNELAEKNSTFKYWHYEPKVKEFIDCFSPQIMKMHSIPLDLESELRNQMVTLDQVAKGEINHNFLSKTKNKVRAKIAQRTLFNELDKVSELLISPSSHG